MVQGDRTAEVHGRQHTGKICDLMGGLPGGGDVPHSDGAIRRAGEKRPTVGAEKETADRLRATQPFRKRLAAGDVPDA